MEIWMICHLSHVLLESLFLFCPWSSWSNWGTSVGACVSPELLRWPSLFGHAATWQDVEPPSNDLYGQISSNFIVISWYEKNNNKLEEHRHHLLVISFFLLFGFVQLGWHAFDGIWGEDSRIEQTIWRLGIYLRWPMTYDLWRIEIVWWRSFEVQILLPASQA